MFALAVVRPSRTSYLTQPHLPNAQVLPKVRRSYGADYASEVRAMLDDPPASLAAICAMVGVLIVLGVPRTHPSLPSPILLALVSWSFLER